MRQIRFLRVFQIQKQSSRSNDSTVIILNSQPLQCSHMEMLLQSTFAGIVIEKPGIQCKNTDSKTFLQILDIHTADQKGIVADDFCRCEFIDLIQKLARLIHLCHKTVTGRNICDGTAEMICH